MKRPSERAKALMKLLSRCAPAVFAVGVTLAIATVIILAVVSMAKTSRENANMLLHKQGYSDISMTGYRFFGCAEDDVFRHGFEATAVNGQKITGIVCSGWLAKGSTIRFD